MLRIFASEIIAPTACRSSASRRSPTSCWRRPHKTRRCRSIPMAPCILFHWSFGRARPWPPQSGGN